MLKSLPILSLKASRRKTWLRTLLIQVLFCFAAKGGVAQLQASFTISKEGGCKPLTVQFTNTTTGAGSSVTYSWDLGNGNTSVLVSPGATFVEEKVYTVTLTAKQGSETSSVSKQVRVYKTPSVDFSATPTKGCMPLEVAFTSTVNPGDGTVSRYLWDFGDGETADGPGFASPKHTYRIAQQAPVSLTVTNSFGCFNTKSYSGMIEVYQDVKADFSMNPVRTCSPADTVTFQNKSKAPPGTQWLWDFGDGKTSSQQSPKHVYEKEGNFPVKLTATTANGCTHTRSGDTLRVGNIQPEINLPESICQWNWLELKHNVQPPFREIRWFANNSRVYTDWEGRTRYYAQDSGKVEIRLEIDFGNCVAKRTRQLVVNPIVMPYSFTKKKLDNCTIPAGYEFTDTSGIGAKWNWTVNFNNQVLGTEKTFRHKFTDSSGNGWIVLEITTDKGCTTKVQDSVYYKPIRYYIDGRTTDYYSPYTACEGEEHQFWTNGLFSFPNDIVKYSWNFGDGGTSTLAAPYYRYSKEGLYQVSLTYETQAGCTYTIFYNHKITIKAKPKASLEVIGGSQVCGNNPVIFKVSSTQPILSKWLYFDDPFNARDLSWDPVFRMNDFTFKFYDTGRYSGTLIVGAEGCRDTVYYKDLVKVSQPFTLLERPSNTCLGDRLTVGFSDSSRGVSKWKWEFGDGTSREFSSRQDTVYHTFKQSGQYQAKLTTYAGNCAVTDSIVFYVLKKQNPVLDFVKDRVCLDSFIRFTYTGFERNPSFWVWVGEPDFEIMGGQYTDGTFPRQEAYLSRDFLTYLDPGKTGMRLFFQSRYFNCADTTNYSNVEIRGPIANFEVPREEGYCVWETITLADSSRGYPGVPITKWRWDIGNAGPFANLGTWPNGFRYRFNKAVQDWLYLDVVDAEGCSNFKTRPIKVNGPKSEFTVSADNVALGTTVQFTNTTSYDFSNGASPRWIMPDGQISYNYNESFTFNEEGEFYVRLYHVNFNNVCPDTATRKITVRKVNARFTHSISYVNNNGCPPAIVRFTSTATNAVRYGWSFGDGGTGGSQTSVTRTYSQPGLYQVWHYSYDENNNVDSSFDFIEIKGPYALIAADRVSACNTLEVTLHAEVKNASRFTWDLGDGTLVSGTDTRITHQYLTAGQYTPSLILEDGGGCQATSTLPEKIVVDSLSAGFFQNPLRLCAGSNGSFTGQVSSYSASRLNATLIYQWQVNNVAQAATPDFNHRFTMPGKYKVAYAVSSAFGCSTQVVKEIIVEAPLGAAITGPAALCAGDTASFRATALATDATWRWVIPGQPSVSTQQTAAIRWATPGVFTLSLVAGNGACACADSVVHTLRVNELPALNAGPGNARVCLGDTLLLTVQGTGQHTWKPSVVLRQTGNNQARVWPANDAWFRVEALSAEGCRAADSVQVAVVKPFLLEARREAEACLGASVTLQASGAASYQWIPSTGLSSSTVSNPVANVPVTTVYKVIGRDAFGCFTDSANVRVAIHPLPVVNAGPDLSVPGGQSVNLSASSSLPGVSWNWSPATYLSCTNCAGPTSRPLLNISYSVKATTLQGCTASDTVNVKVLCSAESIFIPDAFTPNGDGLNERFGVLGAGFSAIKFFRISDRWGKVAFERRDVLPTDVNAFWNGNYADGSKAVSGSYIYSVQVECASGILFDFKGQVMLMR